MHGVGCAQLAGLDYEGEQAGGEAQEEKRIAQPLVEAKRHCMDGKSEEIV
jgi:hypothetical protein